MYLTYARPWTHSGQPAVEILHVVADQRTMVERIAARLLRGMPARPDPGEFPMDFTACTICRSIFSCSGPSSCSTATWSRSSSTSMPCGSCRPRMPLAQEALGLARGHLESLEEVVSAQVE